MSEERQPFIELPTEEEMRQRIASGGSRPTYDFGFIAGMSRLLGAHPRIGNAMRGVFYGDHVRPRGAAPAPSAR